MKKFLTCLIALCAAALLCCGCINAGNSFASVTGVKLYIEDGDEHRITSDSDEYILSADSPYIMEIALLRSNGSTPGYIDKDDIRFEYDENAVEFVERHPEDFIDYTYDIIRLKTDVSVTVKVIWGTFSDEITFKFVYYN